jgi:PTH1 family peptidyl-tRNA hydrolase
MAIVIIGLGNPGAEYANTRHNAGRMVVEQLQKELAKEAGTGDADGFAEFTVRKTASASVSEGSIDGEKIVLVLPETSMNLSGKAAANFVKSIKAAKNLLVIRDELDLPLGTIKMTNYGRGSGGHKGIESIMRTLKTKEFIQMKIGISGATERGKGKNKIIQVKKPGTEEKVIKHVIGKFSPKEAPELKKTIRRAASAARIFATTGLEKAMLEANTH